MSSEDYHRPPIVAMELRDQRAAVWRFRIVMGFVLALIAALIVWLTHAIVAHNDETGGTVGGLQQVTVLATALR